MHRLLKYIFSPIIIILLGFGCFYIYESWNKKNISESTEQKTFVQTVSNSEINAEKISSNVIMLFVGDIMLDRGVAGHAAKFGVDALFGKVSELFLGKDAVIGNLEGTITDNPSISEKDPSILRFTFNPVFAPLLSQLHFTAVSLANNHAFDFGKEGYLQTISNLNNAGIIPFGSPQNEDNIATRISVQGKTICLIGYSDLYIPNPAPVLLEIKNDRESCSRVVLFAHWGVEYSGAPSERQKMLAHEFIDAGADLIIGTHPHVVEPIEIYKNKAIFYSLGNFIFDQYFSFATEHGLAVQVEFGDEKTRFTLVPISIEHAEVKIAEPIDRQKILSSAVDNNLPSDIASSIMNSKEFTLWNNNQ